MSTDIPSAYARGRGVVTNTVSTTPYRSAGRPEVMFVIERLIDLAADRLELDPIALRRINRVPAAAQPYTNPLGITYDSGDYVGAMDMALALAHWPGFPARREASKQRGWRRGIGIANYVEITTGAPRERAEVTVAPTGRVAGDGHDVIRPGPRDELCATRCRMARGAVRLDRLCRARHGSRCCRRRLAFRQIHEAGRLCHRSGDG